MPRPRKLNKIPNRLVGANMPEPAADEFDDACEALGKTKTEVLRAFMYQFIDEHRTDIEHYRVSQSGQPYIDGLAS